MKKLYLIILIPFAAVAADYTYEVGVDELITNTCTAPADRTDGTAYTHPDETGYFTWYFDKLDASESLVYATPGANCSLNIPVTDLSNGAWKKTASITDAEGRESTKSPLFKTLDIIYPPDLEAPSAPTNLSLLNIGWQSIELTWTAATDNVGVVHYSIYRNNALVGTATGTSYTDSGLTESTQYEYTLKAEDSAGNKSIASTAAIGTTVAAPDLGDRITDQAVAFYDFSAGSGNKVFDKVGSNDLTLSGVVNWIPGTNGLEFIDGKATAPGTNLISAIKASGSFSVEIWTTAANIAQSGPSRIISISQDASTQNFMLGQEFEIFEARIKGGTRINTTNHIVAGTEMHLLYTYDGTTSRLYKDNIEIKNSTGADATTAWINSHNINIANEGSDDRAYVGIVKMAAFYAKALSPAEVEVNYLVGSELTITPPPVVAPPGPPTDIGIGSVVNTLLLIP